MTLDAGRNLAENGTLSRKYPPKVLWIIFRMVNKMFGEGVKWFDFLWPFFLKFAAQLGSGIRPEPRRWLEYFDTSEFVK